MLLHLDPHLQHGAGMLDVRGHMPDVPYLPHNAISRCASPLAPHDSQPPQPDPGCAVKPLTCKPLDCKLLHVHPHLQHGAGMLDVGGHVPDVPHLLAASHGAARSGHQLRPLHTHAVLLVPLLPRPVHTSWVGVSFHAFGAFQAHSTEWHGRLCVTTASHAAGPPARPPCADQACESSWGLWSAGSPLDMGWCESPSPRRAACPLCKPVLRSFLDCGGCLHCCTIGVCGVSDLAHAVLLAPLHPCRVPK